MVFEAAQCGRTDIDLCGPHATSLSVTTLGLARMQVSIMVVEAGLYEATLGLYSRRRPTVQLLVNGEAVLSAVNSGSYVTHHSSGRLTAVGGHSAGNVTGLTLIDFLALPAEAYLTLTYQCEDKGQGFMSLRKL